MNCFSVRATYQMRTASKGIRNVWLSCPEVNQRAKQLIHPSQVEHGRYDPKEHLRLLLEGGKITKSSSPLLVSGVRNVLSNCRCMAGIAAGGTTRLPLHAVEGEDPLRSQRP